MPVCGAMHGGVFGYGWIIQIVILIALFAIIWWLMRSNTPTNPYVNTKDEKPIDILKKRLAKGEITKKEFEELKKEIQQ